MENINVLIEKIDALIKINERLEWLLASRLAAKTTNNTDKSTNAESEQTGSNVTQEVKVINAVPTIVTQQPIQTETRVIAGGSYADSGANDPTKYLVVRLTDGNNFLSGQPETNYQYAFFEVTTSSPTIIVSGQPNKKIRVFSFAVNVLNTPSWRIEDTSGTPLTGYFTLASLGVLNISFIGGLFETGVGEGLRITSSSFPSGSRIIGNITYALI